MTSSLLGDVGLHFHVHSHDTPVSTLSKAQLEKIFMQYDTNHDNLLSKEELKKAFKHLGALFPGYRANRGLSHADANGDGQIDLKELDDLVKYAYKLGYTVK